MKHKGLIYAIIIAIGVIGVTAFIIIGANGNKRKAPETTSPTQTADINIQNPTTAIPATSKPVIQPTNTPTPFDPSDPVGNGDITPDEIPDEDSTVKVVDVEAKTEIKEEPTHELEVIETQITPEQKEKDEDRPIEVENEIINDTELEKKNDAEKQKADEAEKDDKPATVVNEEKSEGSEEDKPVNLIDETEEKSEDANSNGNAPVFVNPAQGGSNPFEDGGETEIDDHNSDEFIDEGGDRPGEGIHF
jgi:hypothetical protein